eukprot:6492672-Amphidinium_carterae.7
MPSLSDSSEVVAMKVLHIPYHNGKTFTPTFLAMAFASDSDVMAARNVQLTGEVHNEIHIVLEPLSRNGQPEFLSPHQLVAELDLTLSWEVGFMLLSKRPTVFWHSQGKVRASCIDERALPLWEGSAIEVQRLRRRRRAAGPGSEPEDSANDVIEAAYVVAETEIVEPAVEHEPETDSEDDLLQELLALAGDHQPQNESQSSSNSSSSSSDSSNSDRDDDGNASKGEPRQNQGEPAQTEETRRVSTGSSEPGATSRQRREESFAWGRGFHFVYRAATTTAKAAFHVQCRYHPKDVITGTSCSKQLSFSDDARDESILRLKRWCLDCGQHATRESHQGGRGMKAFADSGGFTHEQLDAQEQALPDPM